MSITIAGGPARSRSARHTVEATRLRQHQVEHHRVGPGRGGGPQRRPAVGGEVDAVARLAEVAGDDVAHGGVVVHDEHPGRHDASVTTAHPRAGRRHRTVSPCSARAARRSPTVDVEIDGRQPMTRTEPEYGYPASLWREWHGAGRRSRGSAARCAARG